VSAQLLPAADRAATLWRNGGGVTREIAAAPPGATLADFDWRISMAEVRTPGPFSRFEQIDRVLKILSGTLALAIYGHPEIILTTDSPPHRFAGDAPCTGKPLGGPVLDLNVMVRRNRASCEVKNTNASMRLHADINVLVALSHAHITLRADTWHLHPHDALLLQGERDANLLLDGAGVLIELMGG
jgi:uncharacterized protein